VCVCVCVCMCVCVCVAHMCVCVHICTCDTGVGGQVDARQEHRDKQQDERQRDQAALPAPSRPPEVFGSPIAARVCVCVCVGACTWLTGDDAQYLMQYTGTCSEA
jgi:hypothetical protein